MFKEFETIDLALKEFQAEFSINALYYDDLKRKIVVDKPNHVNSFLLVERGQDITEALAKSMTKEIADWHLEQYKQDLIDKAKQSPIPYDDLFKLLAEEFRIFYDAAKLLDQQILNNPYKFGLEPMMHHIKSLCFIPNRKY